MQIQPYLFFDGRCDEALAFYKSALGAQVDMLMRFKDAPPQSGEMGSCQPNIDPQKVMHASFRVGDAVLMASDGMAQGKPEFKGITLSINVKNDAEAKRFFDALSAGGTVQQPLTKTFFATSFGMVADKFGVGWMVVAMA